MQQSLCSNKYNEAPPRHSDRGCSNVDWAALLPAEWRDQAIAPQEFDTYRDYEMTAERTLGRDDDAHPCYCAFRFQLTEPRSDDDEEFYAVVAYAEAVTAWRLRDGRWLIHRLVARGDSCEQARGFYSFSETMPQ